MKMSISSSNEYKLIRKSRSLPHLASRTDSGVSGTTMTTGIGPGSCSALDQIGLNGVCNNHHYQHHTHHSHPHHMHNYIHHHHRHHHNHNHHHHRHSHHYAHNHSTHDQQQMEQWIHSNKLAADLRQILTLRQHYYPEGGWGWLVLAVCFIVQCVSHGLHMSIGILITFIMKEFHVNLLYAGMIGSLSMGTGLFMSPVAIAFCRKKSTRLLAVIGGLIMALGCLFTSFAIQFHQLFFSYGIIVGMGVGLTRDCSTIMVAQYFKRKRELVEIIITSGSGLGIVFMSMYFKRTILAFGWRLGLQCVAVTVFLTFFLALLYRSASLYHPQRRAILHLKNQRRKIKDKKQSNEMTFFDFKALRSKTVRIILVSTAFSAFGIYLPIVHLAQNVQADGLSGKIVILQAYLGIAWMLGAMLFGLLVIRNSTECRIGRQYLCQASAFMCGLCMLALSEIHANYQGYVIIVWSYGFFCGGYHYALRMYIFERVRARNFSQSWSFVQFSQSIPIVLGVTIAEYLNITIYNRAGYIFGAICTIIGSIILFLVDVHKRNISRHKHTRSNGKRHLCMIKDCPEIRKLSFSQEPDHEPGGTLAGVGTLLLHSELLASEEWQGGPMPTNDGVTASAPALEKPELTCISEEGIADMDLPDNIFDDYDYIGDCITSCNKVEKYLMLSEFENNLNAEVPNYNKTTDTIDKKKKFIENTRSNLDNIKII